MALSAASSSTATKAPPSAAAGSATAPSAASASVPSSTPAVATLRQARDARGFLAQWLVLLVQRAPGLSTALVLSLDESGALVPAALWPEAVADVSELAGPAQRCVDEQRDVVQALPDGPRGVGRSAIACPVFSEDRLVAAVVMVSTLANDADVQRLLADVQWGAGWIDALHRQRFGAQQETVLSRSQLALDMLALLASFEQVDDACAAMASELARVSGCDRVAVGLAQGSRVRLRSLSHAAWFERRGTMVRELEAAMTEAIEQRATLAWPAPGQRDRGLIVDAQKAVGAGEQGTLTVPIVAGSRAVGAVTWQLPAERLTPGFIEQGEALAVVLAPLLARLEDQSRWWAGKVPRLAGKSARALTDPRRPGFAAAALLALGVLAAVTLVDTTYRVPARAALEGQMQRVIAAPFEGFVLEAPARAGQTVAKGTLLARLDDRDLKLEQSKLSAELSQQEKKRAEAMARHDRAELSVLSAQVAETDAKLSQTEERLARTRIEAPFEGVLVSGDLSQSIGSPVEQGKTLFELAPLTGYRVALKVDERDVREIRPGQHGSLLLSGMAGERLPFTVKHVSGASVEEGQNVFRVEADLDRGAPLLRPGMEGVGKIDAGEHALLWIWTHRLVDWVRLAWWRYVP